MKRGKKLKSIVAVVPTPSSVSYNKLDQIEVGLALVCAELTATGTALQHVVIQQSRRTLLEFVFRSTPMDVTVMSPTGSRHGSYTCTVRDSVLYHCVRLYIHYRTCWHHDHRSWLPRAQYACTTGCSCTPRAPPHCTCTCPTVAY